MGLFSGKAPADAPKPTLTWEPLEAGGPRIGAAIPHIGRTKILGGWLVMHFSTDGSALTFVPDADHRWDGNSLP
jgi:hypothetical protein